MGVDLGLATLIGAGVSAGSAGLSAISSSKMNRRAEKYNKWALSPVFISIFVHTIF